MAEYNKIWILIFIKNKRIIYLFFLTGLFGKKVVLLSKPFFIKRQFLTKGDKRLAELKKNIEEVQTKITLKFNSFLHGSGHVWRKIGFNRMIIQKKLQLSLTKKKRISTVNVTISTL